MNKISFEEWKNSMSFMIDDVFDNNFLLSIEPLTLFINQNCNRFSDKEQLSNFLISPFPRYVPVTDPSNVNVSFV